MKKAPIIIVAVDRDGGFGKNGVIPWHLPEDLKRFKTITDGHICVMGRRTYQEILDARIQRDTDKGINEPIDQILRGRDTFVASSKESLNTPGAKRVKDLNHVYNIVGKDDTREVFVVGGRRLFIETLSTAHKVYLTILKGEAYDCDVHFPVDVLNKKWKIVSGEETDKAYFVVYNKNK